jgi:hypothetical protein
MAPSCHFVSDLASGHVPSSLRHQVLRCCCCSRIAARSIGISTRAMAVGQSSQLALLPLARRAIREERSPRWAPCPKTREARPVPGEPPVLLRRRLARAVKVESLPRRARVRIRQARVEARVSALRVRAAKSAWRAAASALRRAWSVTALAMTRAPTPPIAAKTASNVASGKSAKVVAASARAASLLVAGAFRGISSGKAARQLRGWLI